MNYDDWKATEPTNRYEPYDDAVEAVNDALFLQDEPDTYDHDDAEAEFPQDEHYKHFAIDLNDDPRTIEYRERVVSDLLDDVREFLRFSSVKDLWKLIAEEL